MQGMKPISSRAVREVKEHAEACLRTSETILRRKVCPFEQQGEKFCTWRLCLEQETGVPEQETCAIACGIITWIICGGEQAKNEPLVRQAAELLKYLQRQQGDGGWTSVTPPPGEEEESLVLDTYYALTALLDAGEDRQSESVDNGGQWLVKAANPKGGWSFLSFEHSQRDDISYVLPTCYAIQALSRIYGPRDVAVRDAVDKALRWLVEDCRRSTGAYGPRSGGDSESAVHTAAAIMTFTTVGQSPYPLHMKQSVDWLLANSAERNYIEEEGYILLARDKNGQIVPGRMRRRISHVTFPEGFILQGLVKGGADLLDPRLLKLVSDLVATQIDGCWQCLARPHDERPIYAVMDSCLGLSAFVAEVDKKKDTLDLSADLRNLESSLKSLMQEVKNLSEELDTIKRRTIILSPLAAMIRNMRKYPLYYMLGALAVGYLLAAIKFLGFGNPNLNIASGLLALILVFIEVYITYRRKKT